MQFFRPSYQIKGKNFKIYAGNRTAVAYVNQQGSTRSESPIKRSSRIFCLAEQHLLSLIALHLKWKENIVAGFLSIVNFGQA